MTKLGQYALNNAVAFDRAVNTLLGGDPLMTLSGRMGRLIGEGRCRLCWLICKALDYLKPGHCAAQARREANFGGDEVIK